MKLAEIGEEFLVRGNHVLTLQEYRATLQLKSNVVPIDVLWTPTQDLQIMREWGWLGEPEPALLEVDVTSSGQDARRLTGRAVRLNRYSITIETHEGKLVRCPDLRGANIIRPPVPPAGFRAEAIFAYPNGTRWRLAQRLGGRSPEAVSIVFKIEPDEV